MVQPECQPALRGLAVGAVFAGCRGFPAQILQLYTADGRIQQAGTVYFKTVALAYLPMALSTVLSAWLRCKEHAAIPFGPASARWLPTPG